MTCTEAVPGKTRIGWIGTGVMGRSMCENLLKKGFLLTVYNRTASKAAPLQQQGAELAESAGAVAAKSDVLCLMVGTPEDVQQLIFGKEGLAEKLVKGSCLIDFTTSSPALADQVYVHLKAKGVYALDAPVTGGDVGARNGQLTVMAGGDAAAVAAMQPLLQAFATTIIHTGPAGSGQRTKLANQITLCTNLVGLAEGLLFAERVGLDLEKTLAVLSGGGAASWSVSTYGPRIRDGDFRPGFFVAHLIKDLRLALEEASRAKLALPGLGLALQLYQALEAQGGGALGVHALKLALSSINEKQKNVQQVAEQMK
ncbi:NAD binding domain of 6-phosphogluconate dehydrogenase, putative [Eimeria tenella]|uniref:NAD binding domain of 6-phosphogluconate dehydrogenase, putative n=1 Tax=Eimeria tenella TaxID=5802 RepID=U6KMB7_EIMTE|nr:NAD binding domain of 6-phosphogluconate dehydrogenase, putative [Eimeria tenella]CDJ37407.1 NAD binding domain of 6-phosphogluconate dehydrogenase, putative [Eimeria tenella]|eukprot:XP_013228245.1 NAD binding domain of 6-phosphogluconate dehydrogenase, putative [Eimeria tenella]